MEKLELKHLAPYLPYGLYCQTLDNKEGHLTKKELIEISQNKVKVEFMKGFPLRVLNFNEIKPILRPLSDLINDSCYELLSNNLRFNIDMLEFPNHLYLKVNDYNVLLKYHFDIFRLIEKGLATDINTLK